MDSDIEGIVAKYWYASERLLEAIQPARELVAETPGVGERVPSAAGKRILAVDDEPLVLETLKMLLVHLGHQVQTAHGGSEALRILEEGEFDIVLTDLQMPQVSGEELAHEIKRRRPALPVIFVTANYSPDVPPGSRVLVKPFSLDQLREALASNCSPPEES